ncbi:MAG TPA: PIG-L family deacetylase [Paenibacillaceae bacterium]|nr:PIG-L family deacetylase [Paenibacillaceae bacterium]
MRILYIFPHPDDESFGPAAGIHAQLQEGHEVFLLTLTKGGATKQRFALGVTVAEMGEIRYKEMLEVEKTLGLTGMTVLDFPDSGLKELDPRILEGAVADQIETIRPDIVITYPVHGISGFHDHLITHAIVKRAYLDLKGKGASYLKRLAFFTLLDSGEASLHKESGDFRLKRSDMEQIDCILPLETQNQDALIKSLSCYNTYKKTIEDTKVIEKIGNQLYFEIFLEEFKPPLTDITAQIKKQTM